MTGLNIVSKRRKDGLRWYVYAWRGGPCIHTADGEKPTITPALLDKAAQARQDGNRATPHTIRWLCQLYREAPEFTRLADQTKRDYRLWLDRIEERFGTAPLAAFEDRRMRSQVIAWRDTWAHKPRSADKASVTLSTLLGWGVHAGLLAINVAAKIRHLHSVNKADQIWERRHMRAFVTAPKHMRDALILAALTGLRLGDLVRVSWDHVFANAIIIETRKRKGRAVIPITPTLKRHLDKRDHRKGAILRNSRGKAWTESGLGSVFQKHKPEGFDRTIHDLRGTYVTWLAVKGMTDDEIARIVGWTSRRVADVRARYVDEARVIVSMIERLSA